jgi:hypothetical protein
MDGGEVVSLMHQQHSTPQKHFSASGTLCQGLCKPQGVLRPEGLGTFKKNAFA